MQQTTDAGFDEDVLRSDLPVLVEFTSDSCPPCRQMEPVLRSLADDLRGRLRVVQVDVPASPETTRRYQVMATPTLFLFQGGEPVRQMVGARPRRRILQEVEPFVERSVPGTAGSRA
ncbi:co-chaperone YbbN [Nocardiopsis sp. NRRL B-16309]|uniref:thioredoxin family protein n=1 Tax=Nocardiopsis sp. NRRL B-16309 TaxID=1519494 RepID=UPI0006B03C5D|nr:thioredoxin domain-containing protein [Nocardiopsis sp. NRRL B-16309]KOX22226.1 thioredoxin [Nocardiopsis sp. NRRL B-16309]